MSIFKKLASNITSSFKTLQCVGCGSKIGKPGFYNDEGPMAGTIKDRFLKLYGKKLEGDHIRNALQLPAVTDIPQYAGDEPVCPFCGFPCLTSHPLVRIAWLGNRDSGKSSALLEIARHLGNDGTILDCRSRMTLDASLQPILTDEAVRQRYPTAQLDEAGNIQRDNDINQTLTSEPTHLPFVFDLDYQTQGSRKTATISLYDIAGETVADAIQRGRRPASLPDQIDVYLVMIRSEDVLELINGLVTPFGKRRLFASLDQINCRYPGRTVAVVSKTDLLKDKILLQHKAAFLGDEVHLHEHSNQIHQQMKQWEIPLSDAAIPMCAISATGGANIGHEVVRPLRLAHPLLEALAVSKLLHREEV